MTTAERYFDSYCPVLAPTPPAPGAPPDATLRYPDAFLDDITADDLWNILSFGMIESEHVPTDGMWCFGPFYRVQWADGAVRFWFGADRAACTAALKPTIELLQEWRRQ